jgi:hypothetical protein
MANPVVIIRRKRALERWAKSRHIPRPEGFHALTPRMGAPAHTLLKTFQRLHPPLAVTGLWNGPTLRRIERWFPNDAKAIATGKLLEVCRFSEANRWRTGYSYPAHIAQRMDGISRNIRPPQIPPWMDCSSWVLWVFWVCGFPSPCGTYAWGSSWTMLDHAKNGHAKRIYKGFEKAGDLVIYDSGVGHVEICVGRGRVMTNGSDSGPETRTLGAHSGNMTIYRFSPFK